MHKIPNKLENFYDILMINLCEKVAPYVRKWNFTPNIITYISIAIRLLALYYLYFYNQPLTFGILYLIGYFLDCLDGHYARKYQMTTQFGDYLDHYSDIIIGIVILLIIYSKWPVIRKKKWLVIGLIILHVLLFTFISHFSCRTKYPLLKAKADNRVATSQPSDSIDALKNMCPNSDTLEEIQRTMHISRWVGNGTYSLYLVGYIYLLWRYF